MPTTPTWQLPYPVPGDHTRTWEYWQALAEKIDTQLTAVRDRPLCVLDKTSVQSFADGTFSAVLFDVETFDNSGMHVAGNTARVTATVAGWYALAGYVAFPNNGTGVRRVGWTRNGTALPVYTALPITGYTMLIPASNLVLRLNVGDYLELTASQTSGAPMNINLATATAQFMCGA